MLSLGGLVSTVGMGDFNIRNVLGSTILGYWSNRWDPAGVDWFDDFNSLDVGQGTVASQPTTTTTPFGFFALSFDDTDDDLNGIAIPGLGAVGVGEYLYSICLKHNGITGPHSIDLVTGISDGIMIPDASQDATHAGKFGVTCNSTFANGAYANNVMDTNWHNYIAIVRESTGNAKLWVDGVLQTTQGSSQSMRILLTQAVIEIGNTGTDNLNGVIASRILAFNPTYFGEHVVANLSVYQNSIINGPR